MDERKEEFEKKVNTHYCFELFQLSVVKKKIDQKIFQENNSYMYSQQHKKKSTTIRIISPKTYIRLLSFEAMSLPTKVQRTETSCTLCAVPFPVIFHPNV